MTKFTWRALSWGRHPPHTTPPFLFVHYWTAYFSQIVSLAIPLIVIDTRLSDDRRTNGAGGSASTYIPISPSPRVRSIESRVIQMQSRIQSLLAGTVEHLHSKLESGEQLTRPRVNLSAMLLLSVSIVYSIYETGKKTTSFWNLNRLISLIRAAWLTTLTMRSAVGRRRLIGFS